jgi:mono/diheme cytochrome c family protein
VASLPVRAQPGETTGGGSGTSADGKAIFAEAGCGGCHTLKAAGASGTVGPNLDDAKPSKELVIERVTNGKGVMPSFKDSYSAEQIAAVADYVSTNAGK